MNEISKALDILKIGYRKQSNFAVHCQSQKTTFMMELNSLEDLQNILVVKFKRMSGEMRQFREVTAGVLSLMTLV